MKKVCLLIILGVSLYADINSIVQRMLNEQDKKIEQIDKEWENPKNKEIRELTKKHYAKTVHGDKDEQELHSNILKTLDEDSKAYKKRIEVLKKDLEQNRTK